MTEGTGAFSAFRRYLASDGVIASEWSEPSPEEQGSDYESGLAHREGDVWRIRTARVTPTKPGAFVAVWERDPDPDGTTRPFPSDDGTAGLLVFVEDGARFGVFEFSSRMLADLGITRSDSASGKRGFRMYPDWCTDLNKSAVKTQMRQAPAFRQMS